MSEFEPGQCLGDRYRVVAQLGEGASAETLYCVENGAEGQPGREVVVKVLKVQHLESWKHFELFEREARVLASLRHHGIPAFYDTFQLDDGAPRLALVQELIPGDALSRRLAEGPRLGRVELLQLTLGVLDVLDYLHSRQPPIYHRDIKPSNIVVRPSGAPVLIDFGGVCDGWRPVEGGSTVVGTHGYMPPEQYLGQVGPPSDLYALGATLLHVVGGQPPNAYSFDSGRIEVPDDLPADPAMARLIRALLQPAPRDRPGSADAARRLLLEDASGPASERHGEPDALPVLARRGDALPARRVSDTVPGFVEPGPPGRDPNGPLAPVYRNLLPHHLRVLQVTRGKPGRAPNATDLVVYLLMTLLCVGVWPFIALGIQASHRRKYRELFVDGTFAVGRVVAINQTALLFDFPVDGSLARGKMLLTSTIGTQFGVGDRVAVLYDPKDPEGRSVVIFE